MAKWCDVITLIAETDPQSITDNKGFYNAPTETGRVIYANKKSVGHTEFYQSAQAGILAEMKFDVRAADYSGESVVEYGGKRYAITRSYAQKNGDIIELTLSDLSQHTPDAEAEAAEESGAE